MGALVVLLCVELSYFESQLASLLQADGFLLRRGHVGVEEPGVLELFEESGKVWLLPGLFNFCDSAQYGILLSGDALEGLKGEPSRSIKLSDKLLRDRDYVVKRIAALLLHSCNHTPLKPLLRVIPGLKSIKRVGHAWPRPTKNCVKMCLSKLQNEARAEALDIDLARLIFQQDIPIVDNAPRE